VKFLSATLAGEAWSGEAGQVVPLSPDHGVAFGIVTGNGVLGIGSLQMEGRRPVTSEEFLRGYGDFVGSTLPT
jgi:methionyl-tRNA formyltransferase